MQTFHAFYSESAVKLMGSYCETKDGRKYTALFTSMERAEEVYRWKDKHYVGTITEYGKDVIIDQITYDARNELYNRTKHAMDF